MDKPLQASGEMVIRRALPDDLEQIARIEAASYRTPWPEDFFARCLDAGYECWVLSEGQEIHAYFVLGYLGGVAHLMNLCVRSEQRRKGLGMRLLKHLLGLARDRECGLFLEVRASNHAARELYKHAGLRVLGRRCEYYDSPEGWEDAVVMALPWNELA